MTAASKTKKETQKEKVPFNQSDVNTNDTVAFATTESHHTLFATVCREGLTKPVVT